MPLAMFVGFNNKLQNVVFGQALLRDERADTFEWLFKQFRACMGGKDPIVIFTGMYAMTCASKVIITEFNMIVGLLLA